LFNKEIIENKTRETWVLKMSELFGRKWSKNGEAVKHFNEVIKDTVKMKSNPKYTEEIILKKSEWKGSWPWTSKEVKLKAVNINCLNTKVRRFIFIEVNGKTYALNGQTAEYYHIPVVNECVKVSGDISAFIIYIELDGGEGEQGN
jgi:hypothetical protein